MKKWQLGLMITFIAVFFAATGVVGYRILLKYKDGIQAENNIEMEIEIGSETVSQIVTETQIETEAQSEIESDVETESQIEISSEIETESQTEIVVLPVEKNEFVNVKTYIPDIWIDLKYATEENFTGQKIYDFTDAYLRYGTVEKLMKVQDALREQGLSLKIWDAFRPTKAQFTLWEICPDATYVANPNKGFSSHSRGNTIDVTIVNENGEELLMPTAFDDFSKKADRDYSDCTTEAKKNALLLENLMKENGFKPYSGEWWHFSDKDSYPVGKEFTP